MTVKLEVNLLASEDTRRDILQLIRENITNALRGEEGIKMMHELVSKVVNDYIGSHDLNSLVPGMLKAAFPEICKEMRTQALPKYLEELVTNTNNVRHAQTVPPTPSWSNTSPPADQNVLNFQAALRGAIREEVKLLYKDQVAEQVKAALSGLQLNITAK